MDYYQILGVSKDSSQDDIKVAYKKLAMKYHPDKGGNTEHLSQINQAYETLKDTEKRKNYDKKFSLKEDFNFQNASNDNFTDFFYQNFGYYPHKRKNKNIKLQINLNLRDAYLGREIEVGYNLPSGKREYVQVDIPYGFKDGDSLHVGRFGDDSYSSVERGELYLILKINKDPNYLITGKHITLIKNLSVFDLITGTSVSIKLPSEKSINFKIPQGTQNNTTFCIKKHGIPETKVGDSGNLYLQVTGKIPEINDQSVIDNINEISKKI